MHPHETASRKHPADFFEMTIPAYVLFFLMVTVPTSYKPVKVLLSVIVLGIVIGEIFAKHRIVLHRPILLWTLFISTAGLGFIFWGLSNGAVGDIRVAQVYAIYPLVYVVFVIGAAKARVIDGLYRVLILATFGIILHSFSYIFYTVGWLPKALYIDLNLGEDPVLGIYGGTVEYYLLSVPSLLFLVPFIFAALMSWPKQNKMPVLRSWLWLAFILTTILVFLSGRRGLWLVYIITPLVTFIVQMFVCGNLKSDIRKLVPRSVIMCVLGVVVVMIYLQSSFGLNLDSMTEFFSSGFDDKFDESASIRSEQLTALLQDWSEHPLFGVGHGVTNSQVVRSDEVRWAYELSYVALLFHTGIIGLFLYSAGILWILWMGVKILRTGGRMSMYMLPIIVGLICFLIANATNPYLEKYDFMWVVFLPVALINYWLTNGTARNEHDRASSMLSTGGM